MSVIVAKSSQRRSTNAITTSTHCFPAVRVSKHAPVGTTSTIDSVSPSVYAMAKYYVTVCTADLTRVQSFELHATHDNGVPSYVRYSTIGDSISYKINVTMTSTLNLSILNNDSEELEVFATRVAVPYSIDTPIPPNAISTTINRSMVGALSTNAIDFFDDLVLGVKWLITVIDSQGHHTVFQVFGNSKAVNCYGVTGDTATYDIGIINIDGFGTELTLTNQGIAPVKVVVSRTPMVVADLSIPTCNVPTILWHPTQVEVPANDAVVVDDGIVVPNHTAAKWIVAVTEQTTNKTMALELLSALSSSATSDLKYGRIASRLDVSFATTVAANNVSLIATNNTTHPVTVNLLRIPVGL